MSCSVIKHERQVLIMSVHSSAKITLLVNRMILLATVILLFALPGLLDWYQGFRPLGLHGAAAIFFGFYLCMPPVFFALWHMDRLLVNILAGQVFATGNVHRIRRIRWCCAAVSLICALAGCFYQPLIFLAVIMAFLALVVTVVGQVMKAAVEIREENDLTI